MWLCDFPLAGPSFTMEDEVMWWEKVRELIKYARTEKPDAYEVLRMANEIAEDWNRQKPPTTNDPTVSVYTQQS